MKKSNCITHLFDTIFWYLIYSLPFLMYLFTAFKGVPATFADYMSTNLGFVFSSSNVVFTALNAVFGADGIMPLFVDTSALYIMTWFVSMSIVHLFVDFLLFIPRLSHKFFDKLYQGE